MKHIIKSIANKLYKPFVLWYLKKDRYYSYKGSRILVKRGVFHPGFFFSTKFLLSELEKENLEGKTFLELGAGSGLISFYAAKHGAIVTATDITPTAIEGLRQNSILVTPHPVIKIILSDLFDHIPQKAFDYILINPPYYPKNARNDEEKAWFCGENFEYFEKLFSQIGPYMQRNTEAWVSLSEDCKMQNIESIAKKYGYKLILKSEKKILWETNDIFMIKSFPQFEDQL